MSWYVTMLLFNLAMLLVLWGLARNAPDAWQVIAIVFLAIGFTGQAVAFVLAIGGEPLHWTMVRPFREIEHIGVIAMLCRLFVKEQEHRCLRKFSRYSPS